MNTDRLYNNIFGAVMLIPIIFIISIIYYLGRKDNNTCPVEEIKTIDSLKKVNKNIIIEVEHLDSIKDAQIIEVKELNNDSTAKLFYKLIRK